MRKNAFAKLTAALFALWLAVIMLLNILLPRGEVSVSERRKLAQYPSLTLKAALDGSFMRKFETASLDNFAFRDAWRTVKSLALFDVFRLGDKDGIYVYEGSICKFNRADATLADAAARKFAALKAKYFPDKATFFALIPDKASYTQGYPGYDAQYIKASMASIPDTTFIELENALTLEDYYKTDLHWDQTRLSGVVSTLCAAMDAEADLSSLSPRVLGEFAGAYLGQLSLPLPKDKLSVLEGGFLEDVTATALNDKTLLFESLPVYDGAALSGVDGYDVFLGGAKPVVVLENPNASSPRELVVFRDSFGGSLAPLLAGSFSKITLVDLRYFASPLLSDYVDIDAATDVLFLYSSELLLNSSTLLIIE